MRSTYCIAIAIAFTICACGSNESNESTAGVDIAALSSGVSAAHLTRHITYMASDGLEGRAPGSTGEELTLSYLAEQYSGLGLRPGNPDGTYVQEVPLISSTVVNSPFLRLTGSGGYVDLKYMTDFMGWTLRKKETVTIDRAEMVFVGYGVVAPEYNWDDFKNVDVHGKVLVMLVGDPPLADESRFGGKAMTYYGRWTYKYEIAAEKGAAGVMLIHNTAAAGYPWAVVENSWSGEQFDIVRPNDGRNRCALESWISESAARRLLKGTGITLEDAYEYAISPDFQPFNMPHLASVTLKQRFQPIRSYNAVALLPGNDPKLKNEYIVYTAHWDHLGVGHAVDGDSIYNGALDNASGVAATLEIARAFTQYKKLLRRSVLFINTTAEESGLIGAKHYAANPLYPLAETVAVINIDGLNVWGRTGDVVIVGFGQSELDDYLGRAVRSHGRYIKPDTEPEKGYYFRSDHFPFAQMGVPALYADSGIEYRDRPNDWGQEVKSTYTSERYHKPQDEYDTDWDLSGAVEDAEAYFRVGLMVAASDAYPQWSDKSEFKSIRKRANQSSR